MQVAVVYVGIEVGIFRELAKDSARDFTAAELAKERGASPDLLGKSQPSPPSRRRTAK